MKKSTFLGLGLALIASSAFASNTGFKLNYPLVQNATGSSNNWLSLPYFYFPNGKVDDNRWTPAIEGKLELSPILSAFAPVRQKTVVLTGLCQKMALPMGDGNGDHSRATATWLNGAHPRKTESGDVRGGITADQV